MRWVCQIKLLDEGLKTLTPYPDFPISFCMNSGTKRGMSWGRITDHPLPDRWIVEFSRALDADEEAEMRRRGNVRVGEAFTPRAPRTSDGEKTGLSIDGTTRLFRWNPDGSPRDR